MKTALSCIAASLLPAISHAVPLMVPEVPLALGVGSNSVMACDGTSVAIVTGDSSSYTFRVFDLQGTPLGPQEILGASYTMPTLHGAGGVWAVGLVRTTTSTSQVWAGSEDGVVTVTYTTRRPFLYRRTAAAADYFRLYPDISNRHGAVSAWPVSPAVEVQPGGACVVLSAGTAYRIDASLSPPTDDDPPLAGMVALNHLRGINAGLAFAGDGLGNFASLGEGPSRTGFSGNFTLVGSRMAFGWGENLTASTPSSFTTAPSIPQANILSSSLYAGRPVMVWNGTRWQGIFLGTDTVGGLTRWTGLTVDHTGSASAPVQLPAPLRPISAQSPMLLPATEGSRLFWRASSPASTGYLRLDSAGSPSAPASAMLPYNLHAAAAGPDESVLTLRIVQTGSTSHLSLGRLWPDESMPEPVLKTTDGHCSLTWQPSAHFPADARCVQVSTDLRHWEQSPDTTVATILPSGHACASLPGSGTRLFTRLTAVFP